LSDSLPNCAFIFGRHFQLCTQNLPNFIATKFNYLPNREKQHNTLQKKAREMLIQ